MPELTRTELRHLAGIPSQILDHWASSARDYFGPALLPRQCCETLTIMVPGGSDNASRVAGGSDASARLSAAPPEMIAPGSPGHGSFRRALLHSVWRITNGIYKRPYHPCLGSPWMVMPLSAGVSASSASSTYLGEGGAGSLYGPPTRRPALSSVKQLLKMSGLAYACA